MAGAARSFRKIEQRLLRERAEVLTLLTAWPDPAPEPGGSTNIDAAEAASDLYDQEERVSLRMALRRRLAEVEAALDRIDHHTYGRCERCGMPIQRLRLEALPTARLRVKCQERLEQTVRQRVSTEPE